MSGFLLNTLQVIFGQCFKLCLFNQMDAWVSCGHPMGSFRHPILSKNLLLTPWQVINLYTFVNSVFNLMFNSIYTRSCTPHPSPARTLLI